MSFLVESSRRMQANEMEPPSNSRRARANRARAVCLPEALCARCSMIKVVQHRFAEFRRVFGREPEPFEPLFFFENLATPVLADENHMMKQLFEAARCAGVDFDRLLDFLYTRTEI